MQGEGDNLFEEIFGYRPKKRGTGYEIIVACVLQHLNSNDIIGHDEKILTDESTYQIDAVIQDLDGEVKAVVEAKDYKGLVSRPVIAKLCGDMVALKVENAIIATPNGFAKGAKAYPKDVKDQKSISLYIIRKAKDDDYKLPPGKVIVKEINAQVNFVVPNYDKGQYHFTLAGNKEDANDYDGRGAVRCFYNSNGSEVPLSFMEGEINKKHNLLQGEAQYIEGEWQPSRDIYVKIRDTSSAF